MTGTGPRRTADPGQDGSSDYPRTTGAVLARPVTAGGAGRTRRSDMTQFRFVSFDLLVWDSDDAMTDEQAAAFVQSLNDQADGDLFGEIADPSERIVSFVTDCANRWPGESEASPWASWPIESAKIRYEEQEHR